MIIQEDKLLTADEVIKLRNISGWPSESKEWEQCLAQNLLNVSARTESGELIGVGFLAGNARHAQLVDLVVHPDYRKQGIGAKITQTLVAYALSNNIKYIGLTYDQHSPWLKDFYELEDFVSIDNAMLHKSSDNKF